MKEEGAEVKKAKIELCEKAEGLKESTGRDTAVRQLCGAIH
jgi:hypothetical protein